MAFYLFFILSFQVENSFLFRKEEKTKENISVEKISFGFWRRAASTFHLIIIIYSMIVLIGLYIYQFKTVEEFLSKNFGEALWDENLTKFSTIFFLFFDLDADRSA